MACQLARSSDTGSFCDFVFLETRAFNFSRTIFFDIENDIFLFGLGLSDHDIFFKSIKYLIISSYVTLFQEPFHYI